MLLAFGSTSLFAQIINFPDANFKKALVNTKCANLYAFSGSFVNPDTNNDGEIQQSEADVVVRLKMANQSISNLKGIENFVNLLRLECTGNNIDSIEFVNIPKLNYVDLDYNKITYLKLNNCKNLSNVSINSCPIKNENIHLIEVDSLISFSCTGTLIDTFNLNIPNLTSLYCNNLNFIDVSKYKKMTSLTCTGFKRNILDLRELHDLEFLNCEQGSIKKLKINGLNRLDYLRCFLNQIDSLDLSGKVNLTDILCSNNQIEFLDLNDCSSLKSLFCNTNKLKLIDVSKCRNFEKLYCYYNNIEYINTKNGSKEKDILIHNIPLKYVCCDENELNFYSEYLAASSSLQSFKDNINTYCSFTPGGKFYIIKGENIFDGNNNGCDDLDTKLLFTKFNITNGSVTGSFIANTTGRYTIPVQDGTHTVTPIIENPQAFTITPATFTVSFPSISDTITQDFCITPKGIFRQTNITVLPLTPPARPGFEAKYKIVWENAGNQIESGTLNFTYDETLLDYISATQTADQIADGIVKWNFTNLLPFEKREITVTLKVNRPSDTPPVNASDKLYLTASILDNIFTLENTVVGSYDPNDKTCLQGDRVKPDMVGEYVDYVIRFENTGNFAAENVVVKDIIDNKRFDVSTLQITVASHEVYTRIEGNKVEFIFENIQLPFDETNNDGYIAFKIKTLPTLIIGDSLKNLADIYFDYNFPIRTNEAQTTIALSVPTADIITDISIYPNPVRDILHISTEEKWTKAEIFDISGRIIRSVSLNELNMDVSRLGSGTYFLRLRNGDRVGLVKFVKI
ncbi:MAG: T9SS type A sorting domain-containing protein [Saprospiraceae bacterium]|nr:T9SS type A sorting domain-containing protein [Saprospiraceae bacterium]